MSGAARRSGAVSGDAGRSGAVSGGALRREGYPENILRLLVATDFSDGVGAPDSAAATN